MKKLLLTGCIAAAALTAAADSPAAYFGQEMGGVNGVSDNGHYAVICDEDNNIAYLWNADTPDVFTDISAPLGAASKPSGQRIKGTLVYDVTDKGVAVGAICYADGHQEAAWYDPATGKWNEIERAKNAQNSMCAIAVTPDGKTIAGYYVKANYELGQGQYLPCQWILSEDGEYELKTYEDIKLPFHQGFFPMAQSPDGRRISGSVWAGMASSMPAILEDGGLVLFNEVTTVEEPLLYYKGEWFIGYDEDGHQMWTSDPDDPRIVMNTEERIDGYDDGSGNGTLDGYFAFCDGEGNFYGMRSVIVEDAYGNMGPESSACIYNANTGEFEDYYFTQSFTCGVGQDLVFTNDNKVMTEEGEENVNKYYDFTSPAGHEDFGISKISIDGAVLGGVTGVFSEAIMDYFYYPYMLVTDKYSGVKTTFGGENVSVILSRGHIEVCNAADATVYDMEGRIAARGTSIDLNAGTYVVKAGEKAIKVIVR